MTFAAASRIRRRKPVRGSVVIGLGGEEQQEGLEFDVDYATGAITFAAAPGGTGACPADVWAARTAIGEAERIAFTDAVAKPPSLVMVGAVLVRAAVTLAANSEVLP